MTESHPTAPSPRNWKLTIALAAVAAMLLAAGLIVGTADNPLGLALVWAASVVGVVAVVHPWRRPASFLKLTVAALIGGVACAILHNFPEVLGERMAGTSVLAGPLQVIGVTLFLLAIFVAPAALAVGIGGTLVTSMQRLRPRHD